MTRSRFQNPYEAHYSHYQKSNDHKVAKKNKFTLAKEWVETMEAKWPQEDFFSGGLLSAYHEWKSAWLKYVDQHQYRQSWSDELLQRQNEIHAQWIIQCHAYRREWNKNGNHELCRSLDDWMIQWSEGWNQLETTLFDRDGAQRAITEQSMQSSELMKNGFLFRQVWSQVFVLWKQKSDWSSLDWLPVLKHKTGYESVQGFWLDSVMEEALDWTVAAEGVKNWITKNQSHIPWNSYKYPKETLIDHGRAHNLTKGLGNIGIILSSFESTTVEDEIIDWRHYVQEDFFISCLKEWLSRTYETCWTHDIHKGFHERHLGLIGQNPGNSEALLKIINLVPEWTWALDLWWERLGRNEVHDDNDTSEKNQTAHTQERMNDCFFRVITEPSLIRYYEEKNKGWSEAQMIHAFWSMIKSSNYKGWSWYQDHYAWKGIYDSPEHQEKILWHLLDNKIFDFKKSSVSLTDWVDQMIKQTRHPETWLQSIEKIFNPTKDNVYGKMLLQRAEEFCQYRKKMYSRLKFKKTKSHIPDTIDYLQKEWISCVEQAVLSQSVLMNKVGIHQPESIPGKSGKRL